VTYPTITRPIPQPVIDRYKHDRLEWVNSDCRNKQCIEGYMSINDEAWKCPICTRLDASYPEWKGAIDKWTDEEMAIRLKDRKDMHFDSDYRYRRGKEVMALLKSLTHDKSKETNDGPF